MEEVTFGDSGEMIEAIEIAKGQVPHILRIHTDPFDLAAPAKRRNTD